MKKVQVFSLLVALLLPLIMQAQRLSEYTYSTGTGQYNSIAQTGTRLTNNTGTLDDGYFTVRLPFTFPFGQYTFAKGSNIYPSANGYLSLGTALTSTYLIESSPTQQGISPLVCSDMDMRSGTWGESKLFVSYELTGSDTTGMTLEWVDLFRYSASATSNKSNFQLTIRSNGDVEIALGTQYIGTSTTRTVCKQFLINGPSSDRIALNGTWSNLTVSRNFSASLTDLNNSLSNPAYPSAGTWYKYTRPVRQCGTPETLVMSDVDTNGYRLTWTSVPTANSYTVKYSTRNLLTGGTADTTFNTPDTSVVFTTMRSGEIYYAMVNANCADTGFANYTTFKYIPTAPLPASALPWRDNHDFSTSLTGMHKEYIANGTTSFTSYPTSNTSMINGVRSFYFYGSTTARSFITLPAFATTLSNLHMHFRAMKTYRGSAYGQLMIGVISDPSDLNTFTSLRTIQVNKLSEWEDFDIDFSSYNGQGKYIAIVTPNNATGYTYVDDIMIYEPLGTCEEPVDIHPIFVYSDSAQFSWENPANSNVSSYEVYFGLGTEKLDTIRAISVFDTTIVFDNLLPNTLYHMRVIPTCSNGNSGYGFNDYWFRTSVDTIIQSLPYTQNFDGISGTTGTGANYAANRFAGWYGKYTYTTTYYPSVYATSNAGYNVSAPNALRFYADSNYHYQSFAQLPRFKTPIDSLNLRFDMIRWNTLTYSSKLLVGMTREPGSLSHFDTVAVFDITNLAALANTTFEADFRNYDGYGTYITFVCPYATRYVYNQPLIDNVIVDIVPDCPTVSNISDTGANATGTTLVWDDNGSGEYLIALSTTSGFNPDTCTFLSTYNPYYTLTGLRGYTNYYVRIRAVCTDSSHWSAQYSFMTPYDCASSRHTFVEPQLGTGTTSYAYPFYTGTASYPFGRTVMRFSRSELKRMGVDGDNYLHGIQLYSYTSSTTTALNNYKIWVSEVNDSVFESATDTMSIKDMKLVCSGTNLPIRQGWNDIMFDSLFFYSGTGHLQVRLERTGTIPASIQWYHTTTSPIYQTLYAYKSSTTANIGNYRTYYRPNTRIKVCTFHPQCSAPDSLTVLNVRDTQATISFVVDPTVNYYEVVATSIYDSPDSADYQAVQIATSVPFTYVGLTPNTQHKLWVRTMCSSGDTSNWTMVQVKTTCAAASVPYNMTFNGITGSTSGNATNMNVPCWTLHHSNGQMYPFVYSGYSSHDGNSLRFYVSSTYSCWAALPLINDTITNLQVSFDHYKQSASYGLVEVGVMSDPDDIRTFTSVSTIDVPNNGWTRQSVHFDGYTGSGNRIAFVVRGTSVNYVTIDNVTVEQLPSCLRPDSLSLVSVDTNTAFLRWVGTTASPLSYEVTYGPTGFTIGSAQAITTTSTTESLTLTGLTPGTYYDAYVRTICSVGDTSDWSMGILFETECVPIDTLPLFYGFENYATGTAALVPPCFTRYNDATNISYNYYPYVSTIAHTGSRGVYFYSSTSADYANNQIYSLPVINTQLNPLSATQVSFYARAASTSYIGSKIIVGSMTDPTDISTFHPCDTVTVGMNWEPYYFYPTTGSYVSFLVKKDSRTQAIYLDDVRIEPLPSCRIPVGLALSNETAHTIDVDWGTNSSNGPWQVAYTYTAPGNVQGSNTVVATTPHVTLTNLPMNASVSVKVRSTCGGSDSSEWTNIKTANTEMCDGASTLNLFSGSTPTVSSNSGFLYTCYRFSWTQTIVRANELQNMGGISAIKFYAFDTTGSSANRKVEIYIGHTTKSTFSSTSDWERTAVDGNSNYHKYYDGRLTYTSGWNTIELDSAFTWNGTSNIIIAVRRKNSYYVCSGNFGVEDVSNPNMCMLRYTDTYTDSTKTFADVADASSRPARTAFRFVYCNAARCEQPLVSSVTTTHNSATATWTGSATNYEVALRQADVATWPAATTVSALTHTFSGLTANTQYVVRVRAICDVDDTSSWTEYPFTTADLPCGTPTNLAATTSFTTATLDWNAGINETEWQLHVWNTTSDTVYDVSSKPTTLSGMPQASSYFASVRAVCSLADSIFSEYSDTISFTTDSCAQVSNVQVTPDSISAVVSWNAGSNHVNRYEVTYGLLGFVEGEGTTIQTTTTEATITGLQPETSYDVTVRGFCTETEAGQWTDMVRFRTLASPDEPVAINSVEAATSLTIYPNPANNSTTLSIEGIDGKVVIAIVDLNGRTVRTLTAFCNSGCTTNIDLADLAEGVYMVSATSGSAKAVRRLVVRH